MPEWDEGLPEALQVDERAETPYRLGRYEANGTDRDDTNGADRDEQHGVVDDPHERIIREYREREARERVIVANTKLERESQRSKEGRRLRVASANLQGAVRNAQDVGVDYSASALAESNRIERTGTGTEKAANNGNSLADRLATQAFNDAVERELGTRDSLDPMQHSIEAMFGEVLLNRQSPGRQLVRGVSRLALGI